MSKGLTNSELEELAKNPEGKVLIAGVYETGDHKDSPYESVRRRKLYTNGNGWNYHWMDTETKASLKEEAKDKRIDNSGHGKHPNLY